MQFSTKTRYGIRAMIEIAMEEGKTAVFLKDIAEKQNLSIKYLDHIIASLKRAGLIKTFKGRKSGYMLEREPGSISMYDIHVAFSNEICVIDCLCEGVECDRKSSCAVFDFWEELNNRIIEYLKSVNLTDLVNKKISLSALNH
ncbi:MAG: Rrf2 family transcriptional regulator [Bacteroidota bacterium]